MGSYDYGGTLGFQSALTAAQLAQLYQYQVSFGARMVRIDVFPGPAYGATALGGCCNTGVEQLISLSSTASFPTSGMKTGAGVSTAGLYHYPATITNATIATEFASFGPLLVSQPSPLLALLIRLMVDNRWSSSSVSPLNGLRHPIIFNMPGSPGLPEVFIPVSAAPTSATKSMTCF